MVSPKKKISVLVDEIFSLYMRLSFMVITLFTPGDQNDYKFFADTT